MSDLRIPRGQTVKLDKVDGDLRIGNNVTIQASDGKKVTVAKGVHLEGKAFVDCDLECDSLESEVFVSTLKQANWGSNRARLELTGRYSGKIEVNGNLTVHKKLNVSHSVKVTGAINAEDIDVGGKILAAAITCSYMRVGGYAQIDGLFEAKTVEVGGKVYAPNIVKLGDLRVGGEAQVGGGSITGIINVGGHFTAETTLEFGELQIYGRGHLPANCTGKKISANGRLTVDGNIICNKLEIGGFVSVEGDCNAGKVEVGGKFQVSGSLTATEGVEGYGHIEIAGNFESETLHIGGKFEANRATTKEDAILSGKIVTKQGLKANSIIVKSGTKCDGSLIAKQIEVGKSQDMGYGTWGSMWQGKWAIGWGSAVTQDLYAHEVVIGPMSKVGRVFADIVKLEQGSAAQQVVYTSELEADYTVGICETPKKVTVLPAPPF